MREQIPDQAETLSVSTIMRVSADDTQKKRYPNGYLSGSGDVLLSRAVAHQVSSALKSLTTVFGMGTGVTSLLLPPNVCQTPFGALTLVRVLKTESEKFQKYLFVTCLLHKLFRSSPRPISIGQLNTLPHLHLRPINHIVYVGSY